MSAPIRTAAADAPERTTDWPPVTREAADADELEISDLQPQASAAAARAGSVDWSELVQRIQRGEESGMEDLYRIFGRGIRFYLCRQLGLRSWMTRSTTRS